MIQCWHALPPTERFSLVLCGMLLMAWLAAIGWGLREERRRQRLTAYHKITPVNTHDHAEADAA